MTTPVAIFAPGAPKAVGPYCHAVWAGDTLFMAGQIALEPTTGQLTGATGAEQARRCLRNMRAVLESQGLSMCQLVKVTVYFVDLADFVSVNEVYTEEMEGWTPARTAVQVAALPRGSRIEIEGIACR